MQSNLTDIPLEEQFNSNEPRELPKLFVGRGEVKGYVFTQIKRSNTAYIYEVLQPDCKKRYEVFKRKVDTRFGKIAYPKGSAFGTWAWSARTLEEANIRFDKLENHLNKFTL